MNRNTFNRIMYRSLRFACYTSLFTLLACVKNDIEFPTLPGGANPNAVSFRTETRNDFATRAAGTNTSAPHAINSMGIFVAYTPEVWDNTALLDFMNDRPVERDNAAAPWHYSPEQLWPGTGYLSVFAYAPHRENPLYGSNKPLVEGISGVPQITYTVAPTHDKQVDLLIATPLKDQSKRDYLTIPLHHALTKIAFSARVVDEPAPGTSYTITEVKLSNLRNSGATLMDGANRTWTLFPSTADYTQNIGNQGLKDLPLTATYQSITPADGYLFLMPQQLADNATLTFTYETNTNRTITSESKTLRLNLAITRWNPGDAYNLMLAIDNGSKEPSLVVVPASWDKTEVDVDIKNRILNVSRIEAPVYSGMRTRIYFWSNQPKDSVYVRPIGHENAARYPTGAAYTIDDLFQTLGSKTAANLHYNGFDGVTTASGEGYIDVWHKLDASGNPIAPFVDGDKRHIWLNASGLARNILLNTVIRGNSTATPYVGTFHRWNETGERIVTWTYGNNNWTATVIDEPYNGAILIDNLPSPFMASGQLYGDSDVGDPETAQLNPISTVPVTGTGHVYFRVGWNSRLANRGTEPRYGLIEVTGTDIGGPSIDKVTLYIRQGEQPDYVFEPDIDRSLAVKWSPYNLTATTLTGTTQSAPIVADRSNASFVKYPTQAGGMFQWANLTNKRMAYSPTVPTGTPSPWNNTTITLGTYWASLMAEHESCPPGYRRPLEGSITDFSEKTAAASELRQSLFDEQKDGIGWAARSLFNSAWGYYADGFFDRHNIESAVGSGSESNSAVRPAVAEVGYIGRVFYCPKPSTRAMKAPHIWRSLFFPAANARYPGGSLYDAGKNGTYLTSSLNRISSTLYPAFLLISQTVAYPNQSIGTSDAATIRCVRDIGFSTSLPDYNETVVPTTLGYTASSSAIDAPFINQWNGRILNDIAKLTGGRSYKVRAKVTFTGIVTTGTHKPSVDALIGSSLMARGSTITYDLSRPVFNGAVLIQIAVEDVDWEYSVDGGTTYTSGSPTASAKLSAPGIVILRKR